MSQTQLTEGQAAARLLVKYVTDRFLALGGHAELSDRDDTVVRIGLNEAGANFMNVHADYDAEIHEVKSGDFAPNGFRDFDVFINVRVFGIKDDYIGYALPTHRPARAKAVPREALGWRVRRLAEAAGIEEVL